MLKELHGIPPVGLGTFGRRGREGISVLENALELGYRHLDTAQDYENESECGSAIRNLGLSRDEVFLTTKVSTSNLGPGQVAPSLARSLDALGSDYVDLALIHWPAKYDEYPVEDYIEQLAEARSRGFARRIGVSNFPIGHLVRAIAVAGPGELVNNQVEIHPFLQNNKLRAYCRSVGMAMTCYMPLARGEVASDPVLVEIASRMGKTPGQIALAFLLQSGMVVIPSSTKLEHLSENLAALEVQLSEADFARILTLDRGQRLIARDWGPNFD